MKIPSIYLLVTSMLIAVADAQVTVYTDVAGFDTINVTGTGGTGSKLTFAAAEFLQPAVYTGFASTVVSNTLTDAAATWADDAYNGANGSHYIEIVSVNGSTTGTGVGATRTIVATAAASKTLTLDAALPAGMAVPVGYRVVSHWTLASIFGSTNMAGLQGGTALSADQVQLWNGREHDSYYYQTAGLGGTGWRKTGDQSTNAGNTVIRPDQSVIIKRVAAAPLALVVKGWVKTGRALANIVQGFNFVPNPYAKAMTLASCGLYTGDSTTGIAGGSLASADQVLLWSGSSYVTFYYQTSGLGGVGWRKVGMQSTDASGTTVAAGSSIIVRRMGTDGFTWTIPQHPTAF
ncbi:MAG: TIGR02597 family protein [Verrucomicrobiaceae bacterium]